MDMLNRIQDWFEGKPCAEFDENQLGRQIQQIYRDEAPQTPPDELWSRLKARAAVATQLPPLDEPVEFGPMLVTVPAEIHPSPQIRQSVFLLESLRNLVKARRSQLQTLRNSVYTPVREQRQREFSRNFTHLAVHQMRLNNIIHATIYFV